jgi:acyl-CoA reductase-like NAD-dependent aldehyde dehydrogenase
VFDVASGAPLAQVSQANRGLIARDMNQLGAARAALKDLSVAELLALCKKAARLFAEGDLPLDEEGQSPDDYIRQLSATTGLPQSLCRANMAKICKVLDEMDEVLGGLTRGLDLSILDKGWGLQENRPLSYVCQARALGAVLPNNSPGVHSLWLPAIPLKVPLMLKPGSEEPWTPLRIAQAFMAAGCPPEAFGFYPTDYGGAAEILLRCERSLLFGGDATVGPWKSDPGVQIHGPGRSKIVIGADRIQEWETHLDTMVASVAENSGRSCINASGVWVPEHGRDIAAALARRLAAIEPRALDDPQAQLAAFSNPQLAVRLGELLEAQLKVPGAEDVTARYRSGERVIKAHGCTFLAPTVVYCEDPEHPLANSEFLFPFVSVVQVPQEELLQRIGPTLVVTAISEDRDFIGALLGSADVERLNLGPIPTNRVSWDQPHEGNLFEHLYRQRALQR